MGYPNHADSIMADYEKFDMFSNLEHHFQISFISHLNYQKFSILPPWNCLNCKTTQFYWLEILYFKYVEDL